MKFCWCTLGSENPDACKHCSNYNGSYEQFKNFYLELNQPTEWKPIIKTNDEWVVWFEEYFKKVTPKKEEITFDPPV